MSEDSQFAEKAKFDVFWNDVVDCIINRILFKIKHPNIYNKDISNTIKTFVRNEYIEIRRIIKGDFREPTLLMDRHKIASAIYVSFISATKSYALLKHSSQNNNVRGLSDIENFIYHTIAFEIALSIVRSFIFEEGNSKNENPLYVDYLKNHGFIPPPKTICEHNVSYYEYTVCQIHRTTIRFKDTTSDKKSNVKEARLELFVLLLSNMFFHIERNSRDNFDLKKIP
jgi:hypothetical protein